MNHNLRFAAVALLLVACTSPTALPETGAPTEADDEQGSASAPLVSSPTTVLCNQTLLRTTKSYTSRLPATFRMTMGITRCSGDTWTVESIPASTPVELQYRTITNPPDVPGHVAAPPWGPISTTTITPNAAGTWDILVPSLPGGASSAAYLYRVKVAGSGDAYSDWVQVNYGTRYGLLDASQYWTASTSRPDVQLHGRNFAFGQDFTASIGYKPTGYFHEINNRSMPTFDCATGSGAGECSDAVMHFTKSNRYGYHHAAFPWATHPFWGQGNSHNLFWVRKPAQYGPDNWPEERVIVSNATEFLSLPDLFSEDMVSRLRNETPQVESSWGCAGVDANHRWMCSPSTATPGATRNYILAPEYVGNGWGIWVPHMRGSDAAFWGVHANILRGDQVPGVRLSPGVPVVQFKYYEGAFDDSWSLREDWFFGPGGVLRVEGRDIGPQHPVPASSIPGATRYPKNKHPDIMHREVMKEPNYCMTRSNVGSCPTAR